MRKGILIVSLVSFVFLSIGLIVRLLTKPAELAWPALPWWISLLLITAGFIALVAALILYAIYWYQQERAKEQRLKQWGIAVRTNEELFRCKAEKVKPYKRELWLQVALFASLGFILLSGPLVKLILPQVVPPPPGPYSPENFIKQQAYKEDFPRIDATIEMIFWLGAPLSLLICTRLSKDLAKQSETEGLERPEVQTDPES